MQPEQPADTPKPEPTHHKRRWWNSLSCCGGGFILLLLSIIYSIFFEQPISPRRITCQSNLKQLWMGSEMYAQDYSGRLPPAPQWMDATFPYVKDYQVYSCPVVSENQPSQDAHSPVPKNAHFGYSFNPVYSCRKTGSFTNPAGAPLIYDSTYLFWNAAGPLNTLPNPGRHHGGNNIGFVNGHVHWFSISGSRKFIQPSKK